MARTAIPVQTVAGYGGKVEDISYTAGDAANDHQITHAGDPLFFIVKNGSGSPHTTTLKGVASPRTFNQAVDKSIVTAAGKESIVNLPSVGFDQGSGIVHIDIAADTSIEFAAFRLVATP